MNERIAVVDSTDDLKSPSTYKRVEGWWATEDKIFKKVDDAYIYVGSQYRWASHDNGGLNIPLYVREEGVSCEEVLFEEGDAIQQNI